MGDIYIEGVCRIEFSKIESNFLDPHYSRELTISIDSGQVLHLVLSSHDRDVLEVIDCESYPSMEGLNDGK